MAYQTEEREMQELRQRLDAAQAVIEKQTVIGLELRTQNIQLEAENRDLRASSVVRISASDEHGCPSCHAAIEIWWSYCAMCGWHIASGAKP